MLEAVGLGLVAFDLRDLRRERVQRSSRDKLVQLGAAADATAAGIPGVIVITGGEPSPQPPLEERVARLEREAREIRGLLDEVGAREKRDHRAILDQVSGWVAEARLETWNLRQELRPLIGRAVAGNLGRRLFGLALFLAGLGLQTAGNLV